MQNIGIHISQYRKNKNLTQEELAVKLGVTSQAVSKWERNQSLPDIITFSQLCNILDVSADVMLETTSNVISENKDVQISAEIWKTLRQCQEPLELILGEDIVTLFKCSHYTDYIKEQRQLMTNMGLLMPIVQMKDDLRIRSNEFMVLSYHRILYVEELENIDESTAKYIIEKLAETVQKNYSIHASFSYTTFVLRTNLICAENCARMKD